MYPNSRCETESSLAPRSDHIRSKNNNSRSSVKHVWFIFALEVTSSSGEPMYVYASDAKYSPYFETRHYC